MGARMKPKPALLISSPDAGTVKTFFLATLIAMGCESVRLGKI
jgi:hypothetical protein